MFLGRLMLLLCTLMCPWSIWAEEAQLSTLEQLNALQQEIYHELSKAAGVKDDEKLLVEESIKQKNGEFRGRLTQEIEQLSEEQKNAYLPLVLKQIEFLHQNITQGIASFEQLRAAREKAEGTDKASLESEMQDSLIVLTGAYQELSESLGWAQQLGMDVATERESLIKELEKRVELAITLVRFNQTKLDRVSKSLALASSEEKHRLEQQQLAINGRISAYAQMLDQVIALLDELGVDTAEYKKLLFSMTGNISQDVLDVDVVTSLALQWLESFKTWAFENTPALIMKLLVFAIILLITKVMANFARKVVKRSVSASKVNFSQLLQDFFISVAGKVVVILGLMFGLSQLGIELAPLLAGFGVAGLIIGFALQDTLSNFASGMMILIYRPYDVGDLVEAGGVKGVVSNMSLVSTTIKTLDNQRLILPNNKIWGDTINNITAEKIRRVDMVFGVGYSDDIEHVERVLKEIIEGHEKVLKHPEYTLKLHTLGESSVDFIVRPWSKPEDYWDIYWDITREVKIRFDKEGISIPFPQRDVHLYQSQLQAQSARVEQPRPSQQAEDLNSKRSEGDRALKESDLPEVETTEV